MKTAFKGFDMSDNYCCFFQYLVKRSVGVPGKPVWFGKVFDEETSSAGRTGSPDSTHMRNSHAAGPDV